MSPIPRSERQHFMREWVNYVLDLNGADTAAEAWEYYQDERRRLLKALENGLTVWRLVHLDPQIHVESLAGSVQNLGQFWTCSRSVAENWDGRSSYAGISLPENPVSVILEATVILDDIDLIETIACRLGSSWEDEIRLKPGHPVLIQSATAIEKGTRLSVLP